MSHRPIADGIQRRIGHRDGVAVTEREPVGEPRRSGQHTAHRIPVEFVDQIGQPRAFGVDRRACGCQFADLLTHDVIGREFGAELFGEAAGQQQRRGAVGKRVGQRVEFDDVGPCCAQQFGVLGVAEGERLPAANATVALRAAGAPTTPGPTAGRSLDWPPRRRIPRQIDMASPPVQSSRRRRPCARRPVFGGGDEAEVP